MAQDAAIVNRTSNMTTSHRPSGSSRISDNRDASHHRPSIGGVIVREEDIEAAKGLRTIAILFRGMSILLLVLMVLQVVFGITSTVPISVGVVFAEAVRLIIFAGLLWGAGDLAKLVVKSHYDLRATRILAARLTYMVRQIGEKSGHLPPESSDPLSRP